MLPVDVFLVTAHIDALCLGIARQGVHGLRVNRQVDSIVVLKIAAALAVLVAPRVRSTGRIDCGAGIHVFGGLFIDRGVIVHAGVYPIVKTEGIVLIGAARVGVVAGPDGCIIRYGVIYSRIVLRCSIILSGRLILRG